MCNGFLLTKYFQIEISPYLHMDRYIVREPRPSTGLQDTNQLILSEVPRQTMIPDGVHLPNNYGSEFPVNTMMQGHGNGRYLVMEGPMHSMGVPQTMRSMHSTSHAMSGIDPGYLAGYSSNNAVYLSSKGYPEEPNPKPQIFGAPYQNRQIIGADRNRMLHAPEPFINARLPQESPRSVPMQQTMFNNISDKETGCRKSRAFAEHTKAVISKTALDSNQNEITPIVSRVDKLKRLYKSGPRVFSGPVEKVLKWHKALQDIGLLVIYEIIAKLVSARPGEGCSKQLVIRDENGPAMQVVYYEIDFLLPEIKPPCTVRVVGKIMQGTCRLQAFTVRIATGADVTMMPRRAAVACHHVAKLCKEFLVDTA